MLHLVAGHLHLLHDPGLGFVRIALELLQAARVDQLLAALSGQLVQLLAPRQHGLAPRLNGSLVIVVAGNQVLRKLVQRPGLLLLRRQRLLKVVVLLPKRLDAVERVAQILVGQDGLLRRDPRVNLLRVPREQLQLSALKQAGGKKKRSEMGGGVEMGREMNKTWGKEGEGAQHPTETQEGTTRNRTGAADKK